MALFYCSEPTKGLIQMEIKEILAKIKAAVGEEITPKIEGLLKNIEAEFSSVTDDLKAANAESKERKLKLREMQTQLDEAGEKVKGLEGKANDPAQKQELDALKQFKADVLKVRRESFSGEFAKIAKHPNFEKAKEQLLRALDDVAPDPSLAELERRVLREANALGIGPMGLGGATTLLGVKVATLPRLPASYFVTVAYGCWACRRGSAALEGSGVRVQG
jgi:predicted  nucleic acid-binding Zn-ribbon protein